MMKEHQEAVGNWGSYGAQVQWHLFSTDCGSRPAFLHHTVHIYTLLFDSSFLGRTCASNLPPDLEGRSVQNVAWWMTFLIATGTVNHWTSSFFSHGLLK